MISKVISRYRIISKIASGPMGSVYLARDTKLDRSIALKVLPADVASDPAGLSRFRQEARALAAVQHPNIVVIYDVGAHQDFQYIVMEYLEGEDLQQLIERRGSLPVAEAVDLVMQAITTPSRIDRTPTATMSSTRVKPRWPLWCSST